MLFRFLGGAQEVGRSAILLKDEKSFLLDFGVKLNHNIEYPIEVPDVDAFILSHAHLDHSGFAPVLYNEGVVPAFGTEPTLKLSEVLLNDSLNIAKKEHMPKKFHKRQIATFMHRYTSIDFHQTFNIGNFDIELFDAGHICGSAITSMKNRKTGKRIVYTGDYQLKPQILHKGAEVVESDVLITESTYATREHPEREQLELDFIGKVKETLDNNGNVLLPVFAVGRSQEILSLLYKHKLTQYTFIDGMARKATAIALKYSNFINNADILAKAVEESITIGGKEGRGDALSAPSIIMTTAGMLNGGPVLDYITKLRENSHILLTGYQVEGTNGRTLMEKGTITLGKNSVKINTPVSYYDMSAHAGVSELHEYVKRSNPGKVICVHGDAQNSAALAESLKLEGFDAFAPKTGETLKI